MGLYRDMRIAVDDRDISWHALRGLDFSALDSILQAGLLPTKNSTSANASGVEYAVCLSGSPALSHANNRLANSFETYTLNETALSVALVAAGRWAPNGGFVDEHRSTLPIGPSKFKGIALSSSLAQTPLTSVTATGEPMRASVCAEFITRSTAWVAAMAGALDTPGIEQTERFKEASDQGATLTREETAQLQALLLAPYARVLEQKLGRPATVFDAVQDTVARAGAEIPIILWTDNVKQNISGKNVAIARKYADSPGNGAFEGFVAGPRMSVSNLRQFRSSTIAGYS